jgi:glycosyltransferase involved in cell wall biosynthesis
MTKQRILYIERPASVGGSITGLYQLIGALDTGRYEPIVLFYGPNPYREQFHKIGVQTLTLFEQYQIQSPMHVRRSANRRPVGLRAEHPLTSDKGPRSEGVDQADKQPPEDVLRPRDIAASLARYSTKLAEMYNLTKQAYLMIRQDRPLARRVADLIAEQNIDLVHHNHSLLTNRATVLAGQMARVAQVSHVRDLKEFSAIDRYLATSVDAFIYMSTAIQDLYCDLGIPPEKGHVVYDAFDPHRFAVDQSESVQECAAGSGAAPRPAHSNGTAKLRTELGLTAQHKLITNVGRLDWWKGQDYFIQALAQVVPSQPDVRALLVGAPDDSANSRAFYHKLQKMVTDLGLSNHVIFTGYRSDVPDLLAASEIVIHSSSEPEPFGRVIVEAMLAARPVVATGAGGVLDIIQDQETGFLVPPRDAPAMAQAIRWLLHNPEQAETIGRHARQCAQERFSIQRHAAQVQRIYNAVLAAQSHKPRKARQD